MAAPGMSRRRAIMMMAGSAAGAVGAGLAARRRPSPPRMPVLFVSHGSPMVALQDNSYTRALGRLGAELPPPEAIVVVSAHWQAPAPIRVTASERPDLIYDFYGFADELYRLDYGSPGAPSLASEIVGMLRKAGHAANLDAKRGLDHGVWVPLRLSYPGAQVPVVAVSLMGPAEPAQLVRVGRALAPLRDRRVLLVGSGGVTHNLRRARLHQQEGPVDEWASRFDGWVRDRVASLDIDALVAYRRHAPDAALAVPTTEHFDPLFVVLGAVDSGGRVRTVYEGVWHGNLSMRSLTIG